MGLRARIGDRIAWTRKETLALYLACRDPRVPWYAKFVGGMIVAYALSPIDLIPDFIPVLGYLDDLVIIPAGVVLMRRMVPAAVLAEHRESAAARLATGGQSAWIGAGIVIAIWAACVAVVLLVFVV